ncbi:MAG: hypothetical protein JST93_15140 [Acidobacteria bacterium]|nr:hypothetical protein [Acidobacteriota bacterium]
MLKLTIALLGMTLIAFAGTPATPEINGTSAAGALTLLGGAIMVLRGRRKR